MEQKNKPSVEFISNKTALVLIFIVIAIWALITLVDWGGNNSNNHPAVSATSYVSQRSLEFNYDEVNGLVLKPNRTYIVRFDEPGATGWFDAYTHQVYYQIRSTKGHITTFKNEESTQFPPGERGTGVRYYGDEYLQFRITSREPQNTVTIKTSTRRF